MVQSLENRVVSTTLSLVPNYALSRHKCARFDDGHCVHYVAAQDLSALCGSQPQDGTAESAPLRADAGRCTP